MSDTIHVRKGEELDIHAIKEFLLKNIPTITTNQTLEIKQFGTGASNLTYELKMGNWEAVLRRPPLGPVAPKAHDMKREYAILRDLQPVFPLAPKPYLYCADEKIVGSPFLLMERKHGILLDTDFPSHIEPTEELGKYLSEKMVDTLVFLHQVDYKGMALEKLSNPVGFLERQVHGWINRYNRSKTEDLPEVEKITNWLVKNIPHTHHSTIIHYDYKFNNALFSKDLTEIVGLFDWEMTTIGDPLADLGAALSYWIEKDDPDLLKQGAGLSSITVNNGFYTREEFIHRYALKSGRDVSQLHFYLTFAYFKLAVICQQIYFRYKNGQTNDPRFKSFHLYVKTLLQHGFTKITERKKTY